MAAKKPLQACYELSGASLAAAKALEAELIAAIKKDKPQNLGNLADIQNSWQAMYARLLARLEREKPELLAAVGLAAPGTVINQGKGMFARAYVEYPQIFLSPERPARYFMYAPYDYQGKNFVPADAKKLNAHEEARVGDLLFAGGWLGNAPLIGLPRQGVAVPADAKIKSVRLCFTKAAGEYLPAEATFIAAGAALQAVREYERALAHYNQSMTDAFDAIKRAAEKLFPEMLKTLPEGEGLNVNLSGASYILDGADTCFAVSIRRDGRGKGSSIMMGGKPLPIPENPYFLADVKHHGDYALGLRLDTPEGRALAEVLQRVPAARPATSDYATLVVDGKAPVVVTHGVYKILRYFIDDACAGMTPPQDARPFPPAALAWLAADESDRNLGNVPPPMPEQLKAYFVEPHASQAHDSKKAAPKTPKNPTK